MYREDVRVIELRSGKQLNPVLQRELPAAKIVNLEENDVAVFEDQTPESTDTTGCRSTPATVDTTERDSVDRHQQGVDQHQPSPNVRILQNPISVAGRATKPKVPFPKSPRRSKQELDDARCKAMMDKLIVEIPLIDVVKSSPMIRQYVKRMVTKDLLTEKAVMTMSTQVSDIIQNKIPHKLPDPGSFVLNCGILNESFERCLCNLGSSVNLMPRSVALRLGLTDLEPAQITLVLADRSVRRPDGILCDVPIQVSTSYIPTNFVVLSYKKEPKDPLILGRPFLATTGAIIDVGDLTMQFDMNKVVKKPTIDGQTFYVDTISSLADEFLMKMTPADPLKHALIPSIFTVPDGYGKLLDRTEHVMQLVAQEDLIGTSSQAPIIGNWSPEKAPKVDLKPLPAELRYAFLGENSTYPVIVNASLNKAELTLLLSKLRKYRKALGYSLDYITGISPDLCRHRIHLKDESKSLVEHQRRLNLNLKDAVKKEIMKLLEAGIIYPISDSDWVSPVHVVPKKGGVTVVKNDKNELIPTWTVTGHKMCIDYRKLNAATRKDHFPLPFIDHMLERLANHKYYCFLDGYSGFFQIPIHPDDQEKTTFTCPYGTFAYRRMPFGLCIASATFQRCMMSILTDMIEDFMEVFMDDFSVYGSSFEACLENLCKVLARCEEKNLVLNWEKCHFMV